MWRYCLRSVHAPSWQGAFCTQWVASVRQIRASTIRATPWYRRGPELFVAWVPSGPPIASDRPRTNSSERAGWSTGTEAAGRSSVTGTSCTAGDRTCARACPPQLPGCLDGEGSPGPDGGGRQLGSVQGGGGLGLPFPLPLPSPFSGGLDGGGEVFASGSVLSASPTCGASGSLVFGEPVRAESMNFFQMSPGRLM